MVVSLEIGEINSFDSVRNGPRYEVIEFCSPPDCRGKTSASINHMIGKNRKRIEHYVKTQLISQMHALNSSISIDVTVKSFYCGGAG